jgi:hypothetical protein
MRIPLAVVLAFATGCVAHPARLPESDAFVSALRNGGVDLEIFDFAAAGYWRLSADERALWLAPVQKAIFGDSLTSETCDPA